MMATFGRGSSACMVLNSYHKDCHYEMKEQRGPPHKREYIFGVTVLGVEYLGRGNSKKLAKQAAAASALRALYSLRLNLDPGASAIPGCLQSYCVGSSCNVYKFYLSDMCTVVPFQSNSGSVKVHCDGP